MAALHRVKVNNNAECNYDGGDCDDDDDWVDDDWSDDDWTDDDWSDDDWSDDDWADDDSASDDWARDDDNEEGKQRLICGLIWCLPYNLCSLSTHLI